MKKLSQLGIPIILILFLSVGFLMISISARSYETIVNRSDANFEIRTPIYYIANKIRQKDGYKAVNIREIEGQQILVLEEVIEGQIYETWIYAYNHKLCEAYVTKGANVTLDSGFELLDIEGLTFEKQKNGLFLIHLISINGDTYELVIKQRSEVA